MMTNKDNSLRATNENLIKFDEIERNKFFTKKKFWWQMICIWKKVELFFSFIKQHVVWILFFFVWFKWTKESDGTFFLIKKGLITLFKKQGTLEIVCLKNNLDITFNTWLKQISYGDLKSIKKNPIQAIRLQQILTRLVSQYIDKRLCWKNSEKKFWIYHTRISYYV